LNRLRAFTPWPGAFTFLEAQPKPRLIKIWKAEAIECGRDGSPSRPVASARRPYPGEILQADKTGIFVGCGEHALRILELQRESGRRMSAAEFLAGHSLKCGGKFE
jgi:methionyl-tRNA formyltransferase